MDTILVLIDSIIVDCSKRDLVPSREIVDRLLDLRNTVEREEPPIPVTA